MAEQKTPKKGERPVSNNIRGIALAAMIVGIIGIVFAWAPFWGFVIAGTALALGIVGLVKRAPNRGMALAGTIMGGIGVLLNIIFVVLFVVLSLISGNNNSNSYQQPSSHYFSGY